MVAVRVCVTVELAPHELDAIRVLMDAAFDGDFGDADWEHAIGGTHALIGGADGIIAHASVVERAITVAERPLRCGYVEAVGVAPTHQGRGLGTAVMRELRTSLDEFDLGVLSTGEWHFYERLGWERWHGTTWVRHAGGVLQRTTDEDDGIMVLRTPLSPAVDLTAAIVCEARSGDHW